MASGRCQNGALYPQIPATEWSFNLAPSAQRIHTANAGEEMRDLKSQLEVIFPQPPECPRNHRHDSIAGLYADYRRQLEGKIFKDSAGREITFRAQDFPHLVKLEFNDPKQKEWVAAVAKHAIAQLQGGTLDESRYRIGDDSRPRTLFWVPQILAEPDSLNPNKRNPKNDVYAKRFNRRGKGKTLKIVLVKTDSDGSRYVETSFWSDDEYHEACIAKPRSK